VIDIHEIYFITSNDHKVEEANRILSQFGICLRKSNIKKLEIQSNSLEKIVKYSALYAMKKLKSELIIEDSGLFIKKLNGFPGPFSSYVYKKLGCDGILKLMQNISDRRALFKCVVGYCSPNVKPILFCGICYGNISNEARGSYGFGFDPIFIPDNSNGRTFSELLPEEKDKFSHRGIAFRKFGLWYISNIAKP
jgi:XTP/dITP diphosphohydrolase